MQEMGKKLKKVGMLVLVGVVLLGTAHVGYAGSKGRKNTAVALTGGALYSLAKGKLGTAAALGAGSIYAWDRYNKARREEAARSYRYGSSHGAYRSIAYRSGGSAASARSAAAQTAALQSRLAVLEQRTKTLEAQTAQLAAVQEELEATQQQLATTQKELATTKKENARLHSELAAQQARAQRQTRLLWGAAPLALAGIGAALLTRRRSRQGERVVHIPVAHSHR